MWFICDVLGISLLTVTWALLAFADWVVVRHVLLAWFQAPVDRSRFSFLQLNDSGLAICAAYQVLIFLSWFSHFRAATTDPGTVLVAEAPERFENPRACKLCHRWKPPRAHHCKTCQRCIFRMDHHCPWINNCVGMNNQKIFILFLGYTALSAIVTLIIIVTSAIIWLCKQNSLREAAPPSSAALVCSVVVAVICLATILFVSDFLQEQIESIQMNSTLVETYQRTHGTRTTFGDHFRGIFGYRIWLWPWPFPSAPPADYEEPAVPDDADPLSLGSESDSLGIAGLETEEVVSDGPNLRQRTMGYSDDLKD